jgi:hypothetical protein
MENEQLKDLCEAITDSLLYRGLIERDSYHRVYEVIKNLLENK